MSLLGSSDVLSIFQADLLSGSGSGLLCLLPMHAREGGRDLLYLVSFRDFLRLLNCLLPEFKALPCTMEGFILEELLHSRFLQKKKTKQNLLVS